MSSSHELPKCIIEANAQSKYLELEPPASLAEIDELNWYHERYGADGVRATLGAIAASRTTLIDPDYALTGLAFHPDAVIFTNAELDEAEAAYTDEMREADRLESEASKRYFEFWNDEGIMNPSMALDRIEKVRIQDGDEAADQYRVKLFGPKLSEAELKIINERKQIFMRMVAARQQRKFQAQTPEERREATARVRMFLYDFNHGDY